MKNSYLPLLASLAFTPTALAQGPLAPPPGGPQPSMKTLQQVEPRVDLFNAPASLVATDNPDYYYEIKAPGSYYLSRNASAGGLVIGGGSAKPNVILISAADVTLDLNGFQLRGSTSALPGAVVADTAIRAEGDSVRIHNGAISGFLHGIHAGGFDGALISHLRISDCQEIGILAGDGSIVTHCTATRCTVDPSFSPAGVISGSTISYCTLHDCVVARSGLAGIYGSSISYCTIAGLTGGSSLYGIYSSGEVSHCNVAVLEGTGTVIGIFLGQIGGGSAFHCRVAGISSSKIAYGILASLTQSQISHCTVANVSGGEAAAAISGSRGSVLTACRVYEIESGTGEGRGFSLGQGTVVTNCSAWDADIGFSSFGASLRDCSASSSLTGFVVAADTDLEACKANYNIIGFNVTDTDGGAVLRDCFAADNTDGSGFGFVVASNRNRLINCQADRNNSNFVITGDNNHLDGCVAIATAIGGGTGFVTGGSNNTVVRCSAKNCSVNFALNASTKAGPIVADPLTATNPFSNFAN